MSADFSHHLDGDPDCPLCTDPSFPAEHDACPSGPPDGLLHIDYARGGPMESWCDACGQRERV